MTGVEGREGTEVTAGRGDGTMTGRGDFGGGIPLDDDPAESFADDSTGVPALEPEPSGSLPKPGGGPEAFDKLIVFDLLTDGEGEGVEVVAPMEARETTTFFLGRTRVEEDAPGIGVFDEEPFGAGRVGLGGSEARPVPGLDPQDAVRGRAEARSSQKVSVCVSVQEQKKKRHTICQLVHFFGSRTRRCRHRFLQPLRVFHGVISVIQRPCQQTGIKKEKKKGRKQTPTGSPGRLL